MRNKGAFACRWLLFFSLIYVEKFKVIIANLVSKTSSSFLVPLSHFGVHMKFPSRKYVLFMLDSKWMQAEAEAIAGMFSLCGFLFAFFFSLCFGSSFVFNPFIYYFLFAKNIYHQSPNFTWKFNLCNVSIRCCFSDSPTSCLTLLRWVCLYFSVLF